MNKYAIFYSLLLIIIIHELQLLPMKKIKAIKITVANVQETYRQLQEQGVVFTKVPYRIQTGWAAELQDPAGNIIGITDYNK